MLTWAHGGAKVPDFTALVASYPRSEFKSPRRSTIPLLAYWRMGMARVAELAKAVAEPVGGSAELHFEYKVPVREGRGKPSCTDLMVLAGETVLAIEAKYREARYANVTTWLGRPPADNRLAVLRGWLSIMEEDCGRPITPDDVGHLPYQLIHRAASACNRTTDKGWLIYQLFESSDADLESYLADLQGLAAVLGPKPKIGLAIASCELGKSTDYVRLEAEWDGGSRDLSGPVIAGLLSGDLLAPRLRGLHAV